MAREGHLKDTQTPHSEGGDWEGGKHLSLHKGIILDRGDKAFFRDLMGIQIQKQLSKRQPHSYWGRRVQQSGSWGMWPALTSQCMGKGPAVSMQALGPQCGWHYSK